MVHHQRAAARQKSPYQRREIRHVAMHFQMSLSVPQAGQ